MANFLSRAKQSLADKLSLSETPKIVRLFTAITSIGTAAILAFGYFSPTSAQVAAPFILAYAAMNVAAGAAVVNHHVNHGNGTYFGDCERKFCFGYVVDKLAETSPDSEENGVENGR